MSVRNIQTYMLLPPLLKPLIPFCVTHGTTLVIKFHAFPRGKMDPPVYLAPCLKPSRPRGGARWTDQEKNIKNAVQMFQ